MILLGDIRLQADEIGRTPIGLLRALSRTRAYWIERHGIPEDTQAVAIMHPAVTALFDGETLLAAIRDLGIEPVIGWPAS